MLEVARRLGSPCGSRAGSPGASVAGSPRGSPRASPHGSRSNLHCSNGGVEETKTAIATASIRCGTSEVSREETELAELPAGFVGARCHPASKLVKGSLGVTDDGFGVFVPKRSSLMVLNAKDVSVTSQGRQRRSSLPKVIPEASGGNVATGDGSIRRRASIRLSKAAGMAAAAVTTGAVEGFAAMVPKAATATHASPALSGVDAGVSSECSSSEQNYVDGDPAPYIPPAWAETTGAIAGAASLEQAALRDKNSKEAHALSNLLYIKKVLGQTKDYGVVVVERITSAAVGAKKGRAFAQRLHTKAAEGLRMRRKHGAQARLRQDVKFARLVASKTDEFNCDDVISAKSPASPTAGAAARIFAVPPAAATQVRYDSAKAKVLHRSGSGSSNGSHPSSAGASWRQDLGAYESPNRRRKMVLTEVPGIRSRFHQYSVLSGTAPSEISTKRREWARLIEAFKLTRDVPDGQAPGRFSPYGGPQAAKMLEELAVQRMIESSINWISFVQIRWRWQRWWRKKQVELASRRQAALRLQAWWRQLGGLWWFRAIMRERARASSAATRVAAVFRGWFTRRQLYSTLTLQRLRQDLVTLDASILDIQLRHDVVRVQGAVREFLARRRAARGASAGSSPVCGPRGDLFAFLEAAKDQSPHRSSSADSSSTRLPSSDSSRQGSACVVQLGLDSTPTRRGSKQSSMSPVRKGQLPNITAAQILKDSCISRGALQKQLVAGSTMPVSESPKAKPSPPFVGRYTVTVTPPISTQSRAAAKSFKVKMARPVPQRKK
eukprot:TRINITY_DN74764_c0_g1_i1.p1 TRINITY_DN74764_c0_g1~~TRINITY_DN74764_c0_g1_i1.p1  ORF type:complete len:844 (-),score=137.83 TRINITY_DN74764_c0_g1_i1:33-2372(-)